MKSAREMSDDELKFAIGELLGPMDVDAIRAFAAEIEALEPTGVRVYVRGVLTAFGEDDVDAALELLSQAVALGETDARIERSTYYVELLDEPNHPTVAEDIAFLRKNPVNEAQQHRYIKLLYAFATDRQARKDYALAIELFGELLPFFEDSPANRALLLHDRSRCHFHLGQLAESLRDAEARLALEPESRKAWQTRASVREAMGDAAGAAEDRQRGDAFFDVETSAEERAELKKTLATDKQENLTTRYELFGGRGLEIPGFVEQVIESGWSCCVFPADDEETPDLTYSVGLFYRHGHPEIMVLSRDDDTVNVKSTLDRLEREIADGKVVAKGDTLEIGDKKAVLEAPAEADLAKFPFGYGGFFYRHFMDTTEVPLLLARLD